MAPSPRLSYLVTDQVPPFSQRMAVSLTSDLLVKKALNPILMVSGNWPGASIQRVAVALTSDLLIRITNTHI